MEQEGTDLTGTVLPVDRRSLSMAMGRDNVVHIAITDKKAAARVGEMLGRWQVFLGCANGTQIAARVSQATSEIVVDCSSEEQAGICTRRTGSMRTWFGRGVKAKKKR